MCPEMLSCPCCGHRVLDSRACYDLCPICYWEDDPVQIADPWFEGGANVPCLEEAQRNFTACSAMEQRFVEFVRPPDGDETLDPSWRPVRASDRRHVTTPAEIRHQRSQGNPVPFEYWKRDSG